MARVLAMVCFLWIRYDGKLEEEKTFGLSFSSTPTTLEKLVPSGTKKEKYELDINKLVAGTTGITRYVF